MTLTILPVRNTNGSHMKAGFVKSFNAFLEKEKPVLSADQAKVIIYTVME